MRSISKLFGRGAVTPAMMGQQRRALFGFSSASSSSVSSDLAPGQREGMNVSQDLIDEVGSGGEAGNFKHMAKTGEQPWSVVTGGGTGEPGKLEEMNRPPVGDEVIHASADPATAGAIDELQEEDFAAEADWRRLGNETAAGPSVFDHERPHHILHQGYHGPPPEDSHILRENLKDSDSSQTA